MALKDHVVFWSVALAVFFVDQLTKYLVVSNMPLSSSISVLPFFSFTYVLNTGTAFGLLKSASWLFVSFAAAVSVYLVAVYRRYDRFHQVVFALILAGALGNLVDRLVYGAVIDFLDFHVWPVFNVADSAITIGVILLLFRGFKSRKGY